MADAAARPAAPRRRWGLWAVLLLVVLPLGAFAAWVAVTLSYTYSNGDRVGYNQKFSKKGWLCKTWEGELAISNAPGQAPQLFQYSVRDDAVAEQIRRLEGQRIAITYEQKKGVPTSCFGETEYFVTAARPAQDAPFPGAGGGGGGAPAAAPAAPPAPAPAR